VAPAVSAFAALVLVVSVLSAAVLLNETFTYPDGNLVGNGGWTAHSAAGSVPVQVVSGQAQLQQGSGSREDVNTPFAQQGAAAKTYASFDLTVPTVMTGSTDYFAHMMSSSASTLYRTRVYVQPGANGFRMGLSVTSGGATQIWATDLNYGQTYKIVHSYDAATGTAELWVDPVSEASTKLVDVNALAAGEALGVYALRQGGGSSGIELVDNIKVGQTFSDVNDNPVPATQKSIGQIKSDYR
jgi:hypothetical protein